MYSWFTDSVGAGIVASSDVDGREIVREEIILACIGLGFF